MGGQVRRYGTVAGQRRAQVVAAQHSHMLQLVGGQRVLRYAVAVDFQEVIPHGNGSDALGLVGCLFLRGVRGVAPLAYVVVRDDHVGRAPVGITGNRIDRHRHVAAGIPEGEHRLLADFADDGVHLAGLGVFTVVPAVEHDPVIALEGIIVVRRAALVRGGIAVLRADNLGRRNVQHTGDNLAHDVAFGGRDDIDGKVFRLKLIHQLEHRPVPGFAPGHAVKAPGFAGLEFFHNRGKLLHGHAFVGYGGRCGLADTHVAGLRAARGVQDFPGHSEHVLGHLVRPAQRVIREHHILKAEGIGFAHQRPVQVEHGNAVLYGNKIGRSLIRDR